MKDEVRMIPIDQITILNPRHRDRKNFAQIVQSNRNLGLKKPIQVSVRSPEEGGGAGYDLVCGQGRIEAFQALGFKEIPAIVVEVTKDGINEETADLFKDKPACAKAIRLLKRVTGLRQIEIADLMVSVNNCTAPYAKGHVAGAHACRGDARWRTRRHSAPESFPAAADRRLVGSARKDPEPAGKDLLSMWGVGFQSPDGSPGARRWVRSETVQSICQYRLRAAPVEGRDTDGHSCGQRDVRDVRDEGVTGCAGSTLVIRKRRVAEERRPVDEFESPAVWRGSKASRGGDAIRRPALAGRSVRPTERRSLNLLRLRLAE